MSAKVFIDGHAGTIGIRIRELLGGRSDLTVLEIEPERRKDPGARRERLNACDVAILCLPDDASKEAVSWIENPHVRVIDGSTAFRVADGWVYGLPELGPEQRRAIQNGQRVSNPGCWPTCVSLLLRPLTHGNLLAPTTPLCIHGLSGYTGGGKALIEKWEAPDSGLLKLKFEAPYSLGKVHKHIPEMRSYGGLETEPAFRPSVGPFARGMRVEIPLHVSQLPSGVHANTITHAYREWYAGQQFINVIAPEESAASDEHTFDPEACNGTNRVDLRAIAHPSGHVLLMAILDNLGKGASGAAVQSLNLMLGLPEATGL